MASIEELKVAEAQKATEEAAFAAHVTKSAEGIRDLLGPDVSEVSEKRMVSLVLALDLGADVAALRTLAAAGRLRRNSTTIVLPPGRLEGLSRGRGWARQGRGSAVTWGEKVDGGYQVGPGRWTVGATDGFSRKSSVEWTVSHVTVGTQTWTVAS